MSTSMNTEGLYLHILNNMSDGVYFVDTERRITFWNKAAEDITGYDAEEIIGRKCDQSRLNHIDITGKPLCVVGCPLYSSIMDGQQRKDEVFLRHKEGHRIPVFVNIFPLVENGEIIGAAEIFTPNSPAVYDDDLVEKLSNMAMRDSLTGLPNRRYLQSFMEYKLNEYKRFNSLFSVLFMDIDNFCKFNNEYGHDIGDLVLRKISETIRKNTRKSDLFGRWGGEEFIGVYTLSSSDEAAVAAEKIRMLVANTEVPCNDKILSVTVSVGIATVQNDDTIEALLNRADRLMYKSKEAGKNRVHAE